MKVLVQLRGNVNVPQDVVDTMEMLNLHTVNHATLVPETEAYEGMIAKVNDIVAHGEPSADVVAELLASRGEPAEGESEIDDEWVAEQTDYDDVDALAEALVAEETTLQDAGLSPALRLHPPRGGHEGVKQPAADGGQLGPHETEAIDELLRSMR